MKIEDAVNATKAAIDEGIVSGGGVALINVAKSIMDSPKMNSVSQEHLLGYKIVIKALEAPLKQIAINAGRDDGSHIVEEIKKETAKKGKENFGYDALKDEMIPDMIMAGIVDPVKVTRLGVQNACSSASILLTTEVAVAEEPKEEMTPAAGGGGSGMGGMDY